MRAPRPIAWRPRLWAGAAVLAVAAGLIAFQPLGSPWWTGYDFDSVYVGSGITLFEGKRSVFYDHPGAPMQEALGSTFLAEWAVSAHGDSRSERARHWLADLNRTRVVLRVWGSLFYLVSVLIVFLSIAWVTRSALWGALGGLLFLGVPELVGWAAVVKPDPLLAGLAVAVVALLVEGLRRRSAGLYLAAAAVLGLGVSVKIQAAALVVPLALAVALAPPEPNWWSRFRTAATGWSRAHRRSLLLAGGTWLALLVVVNTTAAPPAAKPLVELLAGLAALAVLGAAAVRLARGTRGAPLAQLSVAVTASFCGGLIVPNLLYANVPAPMIRQSILTLAGRGVNAGAHPAADPWTVLHAWRPLLLVACIGLALSLARRRWSALLWASGAVSLGVLAYLRYGELRYYAPAIALAVPLVIEALRLAPRQLQAPLAVAVGFLALYQPLRDGIDIARARGREAATTERVNRWVAHRLGPGEVALTQLEASDARYFHVVRFYARQARDLPYRFLPPDNAAGAFIRAHSLRVRYLITGGPQDATALLRNAGILGRTVRVNAPDDVYRALP